MDEFMNPSTYDFPNIPHPSSTCYNPRSSRWCESDMNDLTALSIGLAHSFEEIQRQFYPDHAAEQQQQQQQQQLFPGLGQPHLLQTATIESMRSPVSNSSTSSTIHSGFVTSPSSGIHNGGYPEYYSPPRLTTASHPDHNPNYLPQRQSMSATPFSSPPNHQTQGGLYGNNHLSPFSNPRSSAQSPIRVTNQPRSTSVNRGGADRREAPADKICEACGASFTRNERLRYHIQAVHLQLDPEFVCEVSGCKRAFRQRSDLQRHHRTVHRALFPTTGYHQ